MGLAFEGPLYVSIDLDVLDPAFAPGVSHHEPGGMTTRGVIELIQGIKAPIVGADIVEYNPTRDQSGVTAMVAGKLMKEIAGQMIAQKETIP
jgi:arginase family enzyme